MLYYWMFILYVNFVFVKGASLRQGVASPEICETKECHAAADHIKKWMNPAFKPCEDFYEFTCGYWHSPENKTKNNKENKLSLGSRGDLFSVHLKTFLLDDTIVKESKLFQMVKQFMTMCLDEDVIEARGVMPAVDLMRKVGGWPVLEEEWSEASWDLLKTETLFGGVFFKFDPQPLAIDLVYRIIIHPKYVDEIDFNNLMEGFQSESVQKYYKEKCDLAVEFGADRSKAEKEMKDTLQFEIAMSELKNGLDVSIDFLEVNASEAQDVISWVNLTQLLSEILPESVTLAPNETMFIVNPEYLNELGNLINKYPKKTIANYMFSKAALTLKNYLPIKKANITGTETKTRLDMCAVILQKSSLSGVFASYMARQTADDTKAATDTTKNILNELLIDLKELDWLDQKTRSVAMKTLQETKLFIGFPEEIVNVDTVESLYKEVVVNTSYFFEAAIDSMIWTQREKFRKLGKTVMENTLKDLIDDALSINAYFMLNANRILVSAGFIQMLPLFSSKVPAYVNYGHLGSIIAHELTHALDFQADNEENRMKAAELQQELYRWGSNETEEIYDDKKQCIIDQYSSFNESEYTGQMLNGIQTQREDVADNGGLKLAFNAYKRHAAQLPTPELKLPNLEQYSAEQLFMISTANAFCEIPTKEELAVQLFSDSHSPFQFRIKGMMMNSPNFSKMFSCKEGDPMNPKEKCEVW